MGARPAAVPLTVPPIDAAPGPTVRRRVTTTSAFGVDRREGHDASDSNACFTPPRPSDHDTVTVTVTPPMVLDALWAGDARDMDEFVDATTDVWDLLSESATRVGHPAQLRVEPPRRLIWRYTYRGDLVLDPATADGPAALAEGEDR